MMLTPDQANLLRYVVAEFVRRRLITGQPVPNQVRRLLTAASTAHGTPDDLRPTQSDTELIDSEQAAELLNCTPRYVRKIAADLDGQQVAGRWIFHRHNVTEYARNKKEAA
ncbi:MAG: hypothetical protein WBA05_10545 [Gordonia sp. (in: high G+C Gram-positive bacteria)]|uniref:hypothetical protein n=1 Tax=Gordonia sp. (in: high G+C Gram-positive bacteria) TaxID=84139 RepID=UPI003C720017